MKLLTFHATTESHHMFITEQGANGVRELVLSCTEHGQIDTYGPDEYPKYRLALMAARDAGREHTGLDNLVWT